MLSNSKIAFLMQQVAGPTTRLGMTTVLRKFFSERFFYDHFQWASDQDGMRPLKASELVKRVLRRKFCTFTKIISHLYFFLFLLILALFSMNPCPDQEFGFLMTRVCGLMRTKIRNQVVRQRRGAARRSAARRSAARRGAVRRGAEDEGQGGQSGDEEGDN
jgi:hypothetical protein